MHYEPFSEKQLITLSWWNSDKYKHHDALICDGSIRSGKTISMAVGFVLWSMTQFSGQNFAICGKTIESLRRNVILQLPHWLEGLFSLSERRSENLLTITAAGRTNRYFLFGGRDESSYALIQGMTLAGVLFDEVALMPRSFVDQALARCSISGSRFWFNCNPEAPSHWFYEEWILKAREKNALHLHFTMDDNLSLPVKIKRRYESMYSGVFYDRYIRGEWVVADGLVYQAFADRPERNIVEWNKLTEEERRRILSSIDFVSIGVDFGGNRSLTTFVATAILRGFSGLLVIRDHHIKGRKGDIDPTKLNAEFIGFVQRLKADFPSPYIKYCFADSEAQYLINGLRKASSEAGLGISFGDSAKNEITQRIYCTTALLNLGTLNILSDCELVINGLKSAVWDKDAAEKGKDVRLDNFSSDIDILDGFEYSWERFMKKLLPDRKVN